VRDAVGTGASDHVVLIHALPLGAVIITADADFGTLVACTRAKQPSIILMREPLELPGTWPRPAAWANLDQVREVRPAARSLSSARTPSGSGRCRSH